MSAPPSKPTLRAVVLDNDETTGSYTILFAILGVLRHFEVPEMEVCILLRRLSEWMLLHHCFRPGLTLFLQTLVSLRKANKLDAVIMYTNQRDMPVPEEALNSQFPPFLYSGAQSIAYMLSVLAGAKVFDTILTRPIEADTHGEPFYKYFKRILKEYPAYATDIRDILFVDDLAHPGFVKADGIPLGKRDEACWKPVEPYIRHLKESELSDCLSYVFRDESLVEKYYDCVYFHYMLNLRNEDRLQSVPNATIFLDLNREVVKKYGYAPKFKKSLNLESTSLLVPHGVSAATRPKTHARASEGKHEHSATTEGTRNS